MKMSVCSTAVLALVAAAVAATGASAKNCELPKTELLALRDLYETMGGKEWRHQGGWLEGNPCGAEGASENSYGADAPWLGVTCGKCKKGVRHVQLLSLEWNNLSGSISETIGLLTDLRVLNLGTNSLTGELPPELGDCRKLRVLKLSYNKLVGKYPPELLELKDLEIIDLPYNDIVADLNAMLKAYPKLRLVNARGNRGFGGDLGAADVREALERMEKLEVLDLHWNNVGGSVPAELMAIPTLEEVHLSNNQLLGPVPEFPAGGGPLRVLALQNNYVEGELPESLGGMGRLESLEMQKNMVSGTIPAALGRLSAVRTINLRWNLLSGGVPAELAELEALEELDLSANPLGGTVPAALGRLRNLRRLGLHSCRLTGTLPPELGELAKLETLELFNNKLSSTVPASFGGLAALTKLSLRSNRLEGALPEEIGRLAELRVLHLHRNRLDRLPDSVGDLSRLERLTLQDNRFAQPMPAALGRLRMLRVLNMHNNRFTGAGIPEEYGDLLELEDFTAHDNLVDGNPYPRMDPGVDERNPFRFELHEPFCEDLRDYETGKLAYQYFRTCGTRNDFFVDLLVTDNRTEWRETHGPNWMVAYGKCKPTEEYDEHSSFQRTSRFADMREVADKSKFAAYVKRQQRLQGDAFDFHPPTFRMPFDKAAWMTEAARQPDGYWLLKPSISCCGQNIRLVTGPDDPTFPEDEGNWIIQRFVHPPYLHDGHKVVLRLFAIVTSMSPLRVYLLPDGDVFYTHKEYDLDPAKRKNRGNFITDYFFTLKQQDYFTTSNELFDYLRQHGGKDGKGIDTDKIFRDVRDVIVKSLQVSEPQYRMAQDETIAYPESTYEVMGYDILIDEDLKPHVCEVNTTPNMGLEVQHRGSPLIHEEDFRVKTDIMRACLTITGTLDTGDESATDEACRAYVTERLGELGRKVDDSVAWCPEDDMEFTCISDDDFALLAEYECELRRRTGFVEMFPAENAEELLETFPVRRRENHLQVWWYRQRAQDEKPEYETPWSTPTPRTFREGEWADYDWSTHKWTPNTPGNRWNTDEDGRYPDEFEEHDSFIDDGDAFDDDLESEVVGDMSAILEMHAAHDPSAGGGAAAADYAMPAAGHDGGETVEDMEATSEILRELETIDWDTVDWDTFDWDRYGLRDPRTMSEDELDELMKDDPDYQRSKRASAGLEEFGIELDEDEGEGVDGTQQQQQQQGHEDL